MKQRGFLPQFSRADIVVRGRVAGLTGKQIAGVLGIAPASLRHWLAKHDAELAGHSPADSRPSNTSVAKLLIACGVRVEDAAKITGQLSAAASQSRRRAGITPRYQPQHDNVIKDFRGGMTARAVSEKYGIAVNSVYTIASLYGEPLTDEQRKARKSRLPIS